MIITTTTQLETVCRRFATHSFMTIDTEFIREKTFFPDVCLIQIASPEEAYCIDPLVADLDLNPLFELLQNKTVVKVFHSGHQDIEILYQLSGKIPTPVFDTQVGAMVCGFGENVSYQQLVQTFLKITLDKSMRCTNWECRPLSDSQIQYALSDVTYLRDVYLQLQKKIKETHRESWIEEELKDLTNEVVYNPTPEFLLKKIKPQSGLKGVSLYVYQQLYLYREQLARLRNRPRRQLIKDDLLQELAVRLPKTPDDLKSLRNVSKGFEKSAMAVELIALIMDSLQADWKKNTIVSVKTQQLTKSQKGLVEVLKMILHIVSIQEDVAASIITTTDELELFVSGKDVSFKHGWRYDVFGALAQQICSGKKAICYHPTLKKIIFSDIPEQKKN